MIEEVAVDTREIRAVDVDATSLKMSLGKLGQRVKRQDLRVTKHGKTQAIVMSPDRYEKLLELESVDPSSLDVLSAEFDAMVVAMQSAEQGEAMNRLMTTSEDEITETLRRHYEKNPVPKTMDLGTSFKAAAVLSGRGGKPAKGKLVVNVPRAKKVSAKPLIFRTTGTGKGLSSLPAKKKAKAK